VDQNNSEVDIKNTNAMGGPDKAIS